MARVDLNADLGEGMPFDAALLAVVTSANVACGGHAGDAATMRETLRTAKERHVVVGAHPGWPDRQHFGRLPMAMPLADLRAELQSQVAALTAIAQVLEWPVRYVKLHGALANQVAENTEMARMVGEATRAAGLGWLVMAHSAMHEVAESMAIPHRTEAFADRSYGENGLLTPRDKPGAVLHDPEHVADRALEMLRRQALPLASGAWLPTRIDSLCGHGDTPEALALATRLRARLEGAGWQVRAPDW